MIECIKKLFKKSSYEVKEAQTDLDRLVTHILSRAPPVVSGKKARETFLIEYDLCGYVLKLDSSFCTTGRLYKDGVFLGCLSKEMDEAVYDKVKEWELAARLEQQKRRKQEASIALKQAMKEEGLL